MPKPAGREALRACVRFRLPNDEVHELEHGDIIGRLWSAALFLDHPRVSEAHALVSLRDQSFRLLALRGRFAVDEAVVSDVELRPGLCVHLARGLPLYVDAVQLPAQVLAIEGQGLARHVLSGVCSLRVRPRPQLLPGELGDAEACIWGSGIGWTLRLASHTTPLLAGDTFEVAGHTFRAVAVALQTAGLGATELEGGLHSPLRITAHYDTAHIHSDATGTLALGGIAARLLSELVAFQGPVAWDVLAAQIWSEADDRAQLRRKFDVSLARLRKRLREARIRPDLVRANGCGHFELFLHARDHVDDLT